MITITFKDEEELHKFICENTPFAIKPSKKSKYSHVDPFTSYNARYRCTNHISQSLIKKSKNGKTI
jgi:hypothetical protein